jgi:hypothetical protein
MEGVVVLIEVNFMSNADEGKHRNCTRDSNADAGMDELHGRELSSPCQARLQASGLACDQLLL